MLFMNIKRTLAVLCAFLVLILITACSQTTAAQDAQVTAIENVTVLTMHDGAILKNHTVLIDSDRIIELLPSGDTALPTETIRINGTGKYLMPGLTEMHGHIPPLTRGDQAIKDTLFLYLANGVTTVRGMLGSPGQLELRQAALSHEITSPTLYLAGPSFNGNSISSPIEATKRVNKQVEEGWDLLKIHPGLTADEYKAMAAEAKSKGIDFASHVPADVGLEMALNSGQRTIDHIDGYIDYLSGANTVLSAEDLQRAANMTKIANVGIVPTMAVWETLLQAASYEDRKAFDELRYVDARTLNGWTQFYTRERSIGSLNGSDPRVRHENRLRLLKVMSDANVEILFGTDAPQAFSVPGFSIHREIASMVEAGLTPEQVLQSGTHATGVYFADKDTFGLIATGHRADMILLDGNPLEDLENMKNPVGVMVRGIWMPREEIARKLADIEARAEATK